MSTSRSLDTDIVKIPYFHPRVKKEDINSNGRILSDADIERILAMDLQEGRHEKKALNLPFPVLKLNNQIYALYETDRDSRKDEKRIGSGAFGKVYAAQNIESGDWAAIKYVNDEIEFVKQEKDMLERVDKLEGIISEGPKTFSFVMELAPGINLRYLEKTKQPTVKWLDIGINVLYAMQILQDQEILHRDIKPDNIHYDMVSGATTLIDFGMAVVAKEVKGTLLGSFPYIAPELLAGIGGFTYNKKTDVYALGIALAEMYGLTQLMEVEGFEKKALTVVSEDDAEFKRNTHIPHIDTRKALLECLHGMTDHNPKKRYTLEKALESLIHIRQHYLDLPAKINKIAYVEVQEYQEANPGEKKLLQKRLLEADKVYLVDNDASQETPLKYAELKQELNGEGINVADEVVKYQPQKLAERIRQHSQDNEGERNIFQNFYITLNTQLDPSEMNDNQIMVDVVSRTAKKEMVAAIHLMVTDAHIAKAIGSLMNERERLLGKYSNNMGTVNDSFARQRIHALAVGISTIQNFRRNGALTYEVLSQELQSLQDKMNKHTVANSLFKFITLGKKGKTESEKKIAQTLADIHAEIPRTKK